MKQIFSEYMRKVDFIAVKDLSAAILYLLSLPPIK